MTPTTKPRPSHREVTRAIAAVPVTPSEKDDDEPRDWPKILFRLFVVILLAAGVGIGAVALQGRSAEEQARQLLALIDTECGPDGSSPGSPLCIATAPQRAEETQQAAAAAGLDAAQVIELVRAELATNRPADGRTPTTDEVASIVRQVLAANPALYRGEQGRPGDPGDPAPAPTDEQVRAAAAAVMAADPDAFRGRDGESPACLSEPAQCRGVDGRPPVQITQQYADGSSTVCTRDASSSDDAPTYTCPPPTGAPDRQPSANPDPPPADTTTEPPPPTTSEPADDGDLGGLLGG